MGFRTVVMFNNDLAYRWSDDPLLGEKIVHAMNDVSNQHGMNDSQDFKVVECTHADTLTLAVLDYYQSFERLNEEHFDNAQLLARLKDIASAAGYRLVKKASKKEPINDN